MLTGENGILTQATNAKESTDKATEEEKVNMAVLGSSIADNGYSEILDEASFKQELTNQFGNNGYDLVVNGDGSFIITVKESQRKYYVNDDKTVINSDNIIEISSAEELANFREDVNSGNSYEGKAVLLINDIDLEGEEWEPIGYYPTESSSPDSELNRPFKGAFDGCNHKVDNFYINTEDKVQGIFGLVSSGEISNLGVGENISINGGTVRAGVVGYLYDGSKVNNCYNNATIEGTETVGGIVGVCANNSIVVNCYNSGNLKGSYNVGGIVGNSITSQVINCYNNGDIEAIRPAGIAGQAVHRSVVENCYNIGMITKIQGDTNAVHFGIVAIVNEEDEIKNCYYLNGTVNNGNDIEECDGVTSKNSEELKALAPVLGNSFKEDINEINDGYPILYWQ